MSSSNFHRPENVTPEAAREIVNDICHVVDEIHIMNLKQHKTQQKAKILGKRILGLSEEILRSVTARHTTS
jgi:hypothetical protein